MNAVPPNVALSYVAGDGWACEVLQQDIIDGFE